MWLVGYLIFHFMIKQQKSFPIFNFLKYLFILDVFNLFNSKIIDFISVSAGRKNVKETIKKRNFSHEFKISSLSISLIKTEKKSNK